MFGCEARNNKALKIVIISMGTFKMLNKRNGECFCIFCTLPTSMIVTQLLLQPLCFIKVPISCRIH